MRAVHLCACSTLMRLVDMVVVVTFVRVISVLYTQVFGFPARVIRLGKEFGRPKSEVVQTKYSEYFKPAYPY